MGAEGDDRTDMSLRRERAVIAAQACQTCRSRRLSVECVYREPQPTKKDKTMIYILQTLQRLENKFDTL
ncbi:hypothetical protein KCV03_g10431, partial [Aureobasidium melanogenum]